MRSGNCNTIIQALADVCREHVLAEKILLAPRLRVGHQWLDAVTRTGHTALNVRVQTLRHLALDVAASEMKEKGLSFLRGVREEVLMDGIFAGLKRGGGGYLSGLQSSQGLIGSLLMTVRDMRLAGLTSRALRVKDFEVEEKGREIRRILSLYEEGLESENLIDIAAVLGMATRKMVSSEFPGRLFLLASDMEDEFTVLERGLWQAIPKEMRIILPCEPPDTRKEETLMYRAVGEVNEVREVFRRCAKNGISLDDVEILHTSAETYVPLVYEVAAGLSRETDMPVTFDEGIPTRFSRPGRALLAWRSWIDQGYPQFVLTEAIQNGLLAIPDADMSFSRLSAVFRSTCIGAGRERYLTALNDAISELGRRERNRYSERAAALNAVRTVVEGVLECSPPEGADPVEILEGALRFLREHVRCSGELDEYARQTLVGNIEELRDCVSSAGKTYSTDVGQWLADAAINTSVGGKGPRPGCVFVSDVGGGGHSCRKHTFVVGLDDGRFPGVGAQDPLMLDTERSSQSEELPTAGGRLSRKIDKFDRLLARLRGSVTLSYCCRDLADDREMFPSPVLLSAYRALSGNSLGNYDEMLDWLPLPVSFAPAEEIGCLDMAEWWLWRMCGRGSVKDPVGLVEKHFPHLARGAHAVRERESDRFTEYDGHVPEAGKDMDPSRPGSRALSASGLEKLGKCPLWFFFEYGLDVTPPAEYVIDPAVWLDNLERGGLLHSVFREFMARVVGEGRIPEFPRDRDLIVGILDRHVERKKAEILPPGSDVFRREYQELKQSVGIFLQREAEFCRESKPAFFEVSVGLTSETEGTVLDSPDPVVVSLPGGKKMGLRGRIDRVDRIKGKDVYSIWDYKTGRARDCPAKDPFDRGRAMQGVVYLLLAEARLRACVSPDAKVAQFGYFYPNDREHGCRLEWPASELASGTVVLARMCEMIAGGCFPLSDKKEDMFYGDYVSILDDAAGDAIASKMENDENAALAPFRSLRRGE